MTRPARSVTSYLSVPAATPLATALVGLLLLASLLLHTHPADVDDVVAWASTNLHNLGHHPVAAMFGSAFVIPDGLLPELILVAVSVALLERRIGTRSTALLVGSGHVIATLITELGLGLGIWLSKLPDSDLVRSDVGISYVMYTALGACTLLGTGRWRLVAPAALVALVLTELLLGPGMTATGHLLSVGIGLAGMAIRQRRALRPDAPPSALAAVAPMPPAITGQSRRLGGCL